MFKRIVAAIVGLVAVFAGLVSCFFTIKATADFKDPGVSFWSAAFGILIMSSMSSPRWGSDCDSCDLPGRTGANRAAAG
jgi:hypothetical protein